MNCPFCNNENIDESRICNCGYNFDTGEISEKIKIIGWLNTPELDDVWYHKILKLKKLHDFQTKKARSWSITKTGNLLDKDKGGISTDLHLTESFNKYPELKKYKNKTVAKKYLGELEGKSSIKIINKSFEYEKNLHKYLVDNWNKILFTNSWILKRSKYKTDEVGEIDILAKHKEENKWLVIELKKDQASDETIGQLLRYMGFVKRKIASGNEVVKGLIIARSVDKHILYAFDLCPEIELMRYTYSNGKWEFKEINKNFELARIDIDKLSDTERENLIREFEEILEKKQGGI